MNVQGQTRYAMAALWCVMALILGAHVTRGASVASAWSMPASDTQWSLAPAAFRLGDDVGLAVLADTHEIVELYDVLDAMPTWSYTGAEVLQLAAGSDNGLISGLLGAGEASGCTLAVWTVASNSSTPEWTHAGASDMCVLATSGNGETMVVFGSDGSLSLFSAGSPKPFATSSVPTTMFPNPSLSSFGTSTPDVFLASGESYVVASTFTAVVARHGYTDGVIVGACNAGRLVLVADGSAIHVQHWDAKNESYVDLLVASGFSEGQFSGDCSTLALSSSSTGAAAVYAVSRKTGLVRTASLSLPEPTRVFVTGTGAASVFYGDATMYVVPKSASAAVKVGVGFKIDVEAVFAFEPPAPNGISAYLPVAGAEAGDLSLFLLRP